MLKEEIGGPIVLVNPSLIKKKKRIQTLIQ